MDQLINSDLSVHIAPISDAEDEEYAIPEWQRSRDSRLRDTCAVRPICPSAADTNRPSGRDPSQCGQGCAVLRPCQPGQVARHRALVDDAIGQAFFLNSCRDHGIGRVVANDPARSEARHSPQVGFQGFLDDIGPRPIPCRRTIRPIARPGLGSLTEIAVLICVSCNRCITLYATIALRARFVRETAPDTPVSRLPAMPRTNAC